MEQRRRGLWHFGHVHIFILDPSLSSVHYLAGLFMLFIMHPFVSACLAFFFSLDQQQQQTCHEAFPLFQLSYCLFCFAVPDVLFPIVFVYNGSALALFLEKGRKSEKDRGTLRSLHKIKQQQRQQQQTAAGRWRRVGCMHQPAGCKQRYIQAS